MDTAFINILIDSLLKRKILIITFVIVFSAIAGFLSVKKTNRYMFNAMVSNSDWVRYQDVLNVINSDEFALSYSEQHPDKSIKQPLFFRQHLRAIALNGGRTFKLSISHSKRSELEIFQKNLVNDIDSFLRKKDMNSAKYIIKEFQKTSLLNNLEKDFVMESFSRYKEMLFKSVTLKDYMLKVINSSISLKKSRSPLVMIILGAIVGFIFSFCLSIVLEINFLTSKDNE